MSRAAVLAMAALALVGCGNGGDRVPAGTSSTKLEGVTTTTVLGVPPDLVSTTTTLAAATEDLAATTAIPPLDGFTELPAGTGIGTLDLAGASADDPRERDALTRFGFQGGHARGFVKGGEELVVAALRFGSAADAEAYLRDTVDSSLVSNGSYLFAVPVPGATGYREQGAGKNGEPFVTYGALFVRGARCFEQLVRSPAAGPERSEADAQTLARRQADRVGG